jgi:hypothetical protein
MLERRDDRVKQALRSGEVSMGVVAHDDDRGGDIAGKS